MFAISNEVNRIGQRQAAPNSGRVGTQRFEQRSFEQRSFEQRKLMESLIGTVYPSGVIEFLREDNRWAFRAIRAGMKTPSGRVVLDPKKAPIQLQLSDKVAEGTLPWLEQIQLLLATADRVYLRPGDQSLRFLQATHEFPKNQQLITLGDQSAVEHYAEENWQRLKYFYTKRCDGFRFDIRKMFSHRDHHALAGQRIELETRLQVDEEDAAVHVMFDATGSGVHNDFIDWRGSINEGEIGKFIPEDSHIVLSITQVRRPITLHYENREEFKSHAFEFEGDHLNSALKKLPKRLEQIELDRAEAAENPDE